MPALTRPVHASSTQLLLRILEEPQLLAAVRELPAPVLGQLIQHVGLEDAGELIALTSTEQLAEVFDADLWRAAKPGADESFQPARFALWLSLMHEAGESFVVERLCALPLELLTLAVHRLVHVFYTDALAETIGSGSDDDDELVEIEKALESSDYEEWEEFRLIARDPNAWDDVWSALVALARDQHALLREILERCCELSAELIEESGLYEVLTSDEMLEGDVVAEREGRRAAAGFVSPADARSFLQLAAADGPEPEIAERDPITRAYFRELGDAPVRMSAVTPDARAGWTPQPAAAGGSSLERAGNGPRPDIGGLLEVLREGRVMTGNDEARAARQLAAGGPSKSDSEKPLTLMAASMQELREADPALHAQRMEELGYLANVLIAGSSNDGHAFRPVDAIERVLAVCSVGLEQASRARAERACKAARASGRPLAVLIDLGADRLFRAGLRRLRHELGLVDSDPLHIPSARTK